MKENVWKNDCISITPDMVPMRDISSISEGDRLFYEIGFKINSKLGVTGRNWVRTGNFKEIKNINYMLENDERMIDIDYLEHHNFMLIKT